MASSPLRTCVGCARAEPQSTMIRFKASADGGLVVAERGSTGRSAYVHDDPLCLARVAKSRLLARSLRVAVQRAVRKAFVDRMLAHSVSGRCCAGYESTGPEA